MSCGMGAAQSPWRAMSRCWISVFGGRGPLFLVFQRCDSGAPPEVRGPSGVMVLK